MEVLQLNGVTYVKASSIARDLGYTADYVGQLCRSGKVNAQLVGRSWYVNQDSINEHKKTRYRSNTAKTVTALKSTIEERGSETISEPKKVQSVTPKVSPPHFYGRVSGTNSVYVEDNSELIPTLKRREESDESTEVEVRHADAKPVSVRKTHQSYSLKATERPKIRFKGAVSVVEPAEPEDIKDEIVEKPEKLAETKRRPVQRSVSAKVELQKERFKQKTRRLDASEEPTTKRKGRKKMCVTEEHGDRKKLSQLPLRHAGAVAMTRSKLAHTSGAAELRVTPVETAQVATGRYTFLYIIASLLLGLVLSAGLALTETSLIATDNSVDRTFSVNVSSVLDSINSLK